jgi:hypothetical protein
MYSKCKRTVAARRNRRKQGLDFAIVRSDLPPAVWWDGFYNLAYSKMMADWWTKELGVQCYAIKARWPELPERGFHVNWRQRMSAA